MPCRCEGSENESRKKLADEVNRLTRVCCDMRTILRRESLESKLTVESRDWIHCHDEWDSRRIEEEEARGDRQRLRQKALDRLSLDERRALGL